MDIGTEAENGQEKQQLPDLVKQPQQEAECNDDSSSTVSSIEYRPLLIDENDNGEYTANSLPHIFLYIYV